VPLGWTDLPTRAWQLADLVNEASFEREGEELVDQGLFVALEPRGFHLLALR
jgi:hypothetical protein